MFTGRPDPQADVEPDQLLPGQPGRCRPGHGRLQLHTRVGCYRSCLHHDHFSAMIAIIAMNHDPWPMNIIIIIIYVNMVMVKRI